MRKLTVLYRLLKRTGASKILFSYVLYVLAASLVVFLVDPNINSYADALWYNYAVISTIGFGDIVASALITKILSLTVTIYSTIIIAIITGIIVNYYNQILELQKKDTLTAFMVQLEHLPDCSKEELAELSDRVRQFNTNNNIKK